MSVLELNGHVYDHSSLKLGFLGNTMIRDLVKGFRWEHGFDVSKSYATSPVPLPRNRGRYSATASLEVYLEAWEQLLSSGALPNGYLEMEPFTVVATYKSRGSRPMKIEAIGCSILKSGGSSSADQNGAIVVSLPLDVRYILENGRFPFATTVE